MPKYFPDAIHNSIAAFRETKGISQATLAEEVGVSRQTIIAIEKGNYSPTIILALKIARYFGVCVDDLFSL